MSAAATVLPSSASRLNVEHAFRCKRGDQCHSNDADVETLTVSMMSSDMPSLEMYSRSSGGGGSADFPVPRIKISGTKQRNER